MSHIFGINLLATIRSHRYNPGRVKAGKDFLPLAHAAE